MEKFVLERIGDKWQLSAGDKLLKELSKADGETVVKALLSQDGKQEAIEVLTAN